MIDQEFIKSCITEWNRERKLPDDMAVLLITSHQEALLEIERLKNSRDRYSTLYKEFVDGTLEKNITKEYTKACGALKIAQDFLDSLVQENLPDEHRARCVIALKQIEDVLK